MEVSNNPILVERYRGDVLESFHRGSICMVDKDGKVIYSVGDVNQVSFPRSALKLFQILPLLESGAVEAFGFSLEEIAIMCGSHNGEEIHQRVVSSILRKIGLHKTDLQCGAQYPTLNDDRNILIKEDRMPEDIHNNCSGKHAGFLAYCVYKKLDTHSYLDPKHPLQQEILKVTSEMHDVPVEQIQTALDGCSAPIFSLTLYQQANGYRNLINPFRFSEARQQACHTVINALTSHPYLIAGGKRYCTEMMELCGSRIFGKTGADGIYSLGFIREKIACSIKIDDGLMGPQYSVAQELIERSGIFPKEKLAPLHDYIEAPIVNWAKHETGTIRVNESAFSKFNFPVPAMTKV